jgi:hypothetical protein
VPAANATGGEGDIDANGLGLLRPERNKNGHTSSVFRIGHDIFEREGLRDRLSVFRHTLDMKRQRFLGHRARVIQGRTRGDHARNIRK